MASAPIARKRGLDLALSPTTQKRSCTASLENRSSLRDCFTVEKRRTIYVHTQVGWGKKGFASVDRRSRESYTTTNLKERQLVLLNEWLTTFLQHSSTIRKREKVTTSLSLSLSLSLSVSLCERPRPLDAHWFCFPLVFCCTLNLNWFNELANSWQNQRISSDIHVTCIVTRLSVWRMRNRLIKLIPLIFPSTEYRYALFHVVSYVRYPFSSCVKYMCSELKHKKEEKCHMKFDTKRSVTELANK